MNSSSRSDKPRLLSLNAGALRPIPGARRPGLTGIFKTPMQGRVLCTADGLRGDHIGSQKYHGGPDQALCLYSAEDYAWWETSLGRPLAFGTFGENLTVSHFGRARPRIGDLWHIGEVILQLSAPRIPCATLAQRLGEPTFVKRFAQANRGGAYARVLQAGWLQSGQAVTIEQAGPQNPTIEELFSLSLNRPKDPVLLRRALASPLASLARADMEKWLARA